VVVVDASAILAVVFPDERNGRAIDLGRQLLESYAIAPAIWPTEVANALVVGLRRGRITAPQLEACVTALARFEVAVQPPPELAAVGRLCDLALEDGVTIDDAAYLSLALRHGAELVTHDEALASAARPRGIRLWGDA